MMTKIREGYKETEIGIIPEDWKIDFLDNVAQRLTGHTPNKKIESYWGGEIPWVSLKDTFRLDKGYVYETTDYTTIDGINNSSAVLLPEGTVIISRDATVGKVGITSTEMATSQHFINYVCGESLNNKYLYYTLLKRKGEFVRIAIGSTIKTIGMPYFKALKVMVPPLPEQQRIAEILSSTDSHIEKLDKIIEDYQLLKKGMMKKLLTEGIGHTEFKENEIGRIPKTWEVQKISDICKIGRGRVISKKEIEENFGEYPVYSSQTTNDGCMGSINTYDFEGEYVTWTTDGVNAGSTFYRNGKFNCTNVCGTLKLKNTTLISHKFLSLILNSFTDKYVVRNGNPKLMNNIMGLIEIPIPNTFDEQSKIAETVFAFDEVLRLVESEKADFQLLKKSLMDKLLTGKIRVDLRSV